MARENRDRRYMDVHIIAESTSLSNTQVRHYIARGMVKEPLSEADLAELRRIRRLRELGVNLAGIEIILHMRQRMQSLHNELAHWRRFAGRTGGTGQQDAWQRLLPWEPE